MVISRPLKSRSRRRSNTRRVTPGASLLGWAMMRQGRYEEAIAILDEVLGRIR